MCRFAFIFMPAVVALSWLAANVVAAADLFDRHTADILQNAVAKAKPLKELSLNAAGELKTLSPKISSPCLVIRTNEGNWVKALVGWGFRKGPEKPVPIVVLERFVTYRGDRSNTTSAHGKDVMLFAGFAYDFDIGQVVPAALGGDVQVDDAGLLKPLGKTELYGLDGSALAPGDDETPDPDDHEGVLPRDFTGTWQVNVDGRWKGELELTIDDLGKASGTYRSDESKSNYDVTGRVSGVPHRLRLQLHLDNATQTFEAYLWTGDKSAMSGTATLAERTFGFHAARMKTSNEKNGEKSK